MTQQEKKAVATIAAIYCFRMLGLFMILPVFAIYAHHLSGTTPFLIGIALGIYGLSQAFLQIPLGLLSDRFGRKPIICFGLFLFAIGSVVAACSYSIWGIIIGRCLQGTGAIGSTLLALLADTTQEENRTKAMATIGLVIGTSFAIAMLTGPLISAHFGIHGIFWLTALLAIAGIILLFSSFGEEKPQHFHSDTQAAPRLLKSVLRNRELLCLDAGIFFQHAILTALFTVLPLTLLNTVGLNKTAHWQVYLPVMACSFITMVPFIIIAEKRRKMRTSFLLAIGSLLIAQTSLQFFHTQLWQVIAALYLYFTGFNLLEAMLPSWISKAAPAGSKGTAMGVYSSAQFLGIFAGGSLGGYLLGQHHPEAVYYLCGSLAFVWLMIATLMPHPRYLSTHLMKLPPLSREKSEQLAQQFLSVPGVADANVDANGNTVHLKIDKQSFDPEKTKEWLLKRSDLR